jgi:hypothetical protein
MRCIMQSKGKIMRMTACTVCVVLLLAGLAAGYTVVLKTGKRVEGTVVSDDETAIRIRDADGLVLTLKKATIDEGATESANPKQEPQTAPAADRTEKPQSEKSVAEIAAEAQKKKTGKARTVTEEDLKDAPELSIIGTEEATGKGEKKSTLSGQARNEKGWRLRARRLKQRQALAQTHCQNHLIRGKTGSTPPESPCPMLDEVNREIEDFKEQARKASVPWQWIEELE